MFGISSFEMTSQSAKEDVEGRRSYMTMVGWLRDQGAPVLCPRAVHVFEPSSANLRLCACYF